MAVSDMEERFDAVSAEPGTLAHVAREAARAAARTISLAAGDSDSSAVTTVVQQLEVAAHQAGRYLNYPTPEPLEEAPERGNDGDAPDDE